MEDDEIVVLDEYLPNDWEIKCQIQRRQNSTKSVSETHVGAALAQHSNGTTVECGICLDTVEQMKVLNKKIMSTFCGHVFCDACLSTVNGRRSRTCPICRKRLNSSLNHQLFI